ncbi:MAG: hypothetical protein WC635_09500 [Bacteriovorax sp.]
MNKILILILITTMQAFAADMDTVIVLQSMDSRGKTVSSDVVFVKNGFLIVNREKLSATEVITQSENITKIATFKESETANNCDSGMFKHTLKKGKLLKIEKGCLSSERYKSLSDDFRALKKDRITE